MKHSGFTLVELLVAIAVIAMLTGILMPVLRTTQQQARAVACSSNLRQLLLALTSYERENGVFPYGFDDSQIGFKLGLPVPVPPNGGYPGSSNNDMQGWWWFNFLPDAVRGDYGKGSILWCPSRYIKTLKTKKYVLCGNYGVNRSVCRNPRKTLGDEFLGSPLGLNQIPRPAETMLITDSGYSLISWRAAAEVSGTIFENASREDVFYLPGLEINWEERDILFDYRQDATTGRHPGKTVNVGFTDGHESRLKASDLFVEKRGNSYINLSPLWQPQK